MIATKLSSRFTSVLSIVVVVVRSLPVSCEVRYSKKLTKLDRFHDSRLITNGVQLARAEFSKFSEVAYS